jgi:hypothetical protein
MDTNIRNTTVYKVYKIKHLIEIDNHNNLYIHSSFKGFNKGFNNFDVKFSKERRVAKWKCLQSCKVEADF